MIQPAEIQKKATRKYADYLRSVVSGEAYFPLEIKGSKGKTTTSLQQLFPALQSLLAASKDGQGFGYQVELKSVNTRHAGQMSMPKRIFFENETDYLLFLGKTTEVVQFRQQLGRTRMKLPELVPFIAQHPLKMIKHLAVWADLLKVAQYFLEYPKPNCYLRELPIEIHTKFIETHKAIISEMLDWILPSDHYFPSEKQFEQRYGLRYDQPLLRVRSLDDDMLQDFPVFVEDISLPIAQFQQLQVQATQVFIIENKQTFLAFPKRACSIAIWGKGFAVELLKQVNWLHDKQIFFWGDLDVQGFQMLHQLRSHFPNLASMLMDKNTYEQFRQYATRGTSNKIMQLPQLNIAEQTMFEYLQECPIEQSRLEQEHLSQAHLLEYLDSLL